MIERGLITIIPTDESHPRAIYFDQSSSARDRNRDWSGTIRRFDGIIPGWRVKLCVSLATDESSASRCDHHKSNHTPSSRRLWSEKSNGGSTRKGVHSRWLHRDGVTNGASARTRNENGAAAINVRAEKFRYGCALGNERASFATAARQRGKSTPRRGVISSEGLESEFTSL